MKLIFVTEDNTTIREGVKLYLESSGYRVLTFGTLKEEKQAFSISKPDLLIQDVMLPDGNGFDFVKELKAKSDVPVIFMTAMIAEEDRLKGFELGADDYITKPFSAKELVMRVQAIFRRLDNAGKTNSVTEKPQKPENNPMYFKAEDAILMFNEFEHKISVNGKTVMLTSAEWRILKLFISNASIVLSRQEILKECFDYTSQSYQRIADTHVKNLRAKLGSYPWIETVRGYGYKFIAFPAEAPEIKGKK